jgi:hypothetical protein
MVIIIWVTQKQIAFGKYVRGIDSWGRKSCLARISEGQYITGFILQIATMFITKIGSSLLISNNTRWGFNAYATMIGS